MSNMLRRQRSFAALFQAKPEDEEEYPPPPTGLTRAVFRAKTASSLEKSVIVSTSSSGGLIHRVSSLFRNTSASFKAGSPSSARYKAAASTPDVRSSPGKLLKRPSVRRTNTTDKGRDRSMTPPEQQQTPNKPVKSVKSAKSAKSATSTSSKAGFTKSNASPASLGRNKPLPHRNSSISTNGEDDEGDIRRPSGLGRPSSMRSTSGDEDALSSDAMLSTSRADATTPKPREMAFPRSSDSHSTSDDEEEDIRQPSGLGRAASMRSLSQENLYDVPGMPPDHHSRPRTRSSPASTLMHLHTMLGLAPPLPPPTRIAATIAPSIWRAVMGHLSLADTSHCALVSHAMCEGARGRLYGVVDLRRRRGTEDGTRRRLADTMRFPHLATLVQGAICSGWPGSGFDTIAEHQFPSLRSLTIFSPPPPQIPTTENEPARSLDFTSLLAFLCGHPTLERLAIIGDAASDEQVLESIEITNSSNGSFLPKLTHLHAPPAIACVLLERAAVAPAPVLEAPTSPTTPDSPGKKALSAEALALLAPDSPKLKHSRSIREKKIPRKPVPKHSLEEGDHERTGSANLGLARATSVSARAVHLPVSPSKTPSPPPHPLRVLRIAMPRPLYETSSSGAGTVGSGRIGRAIGSLLSTTKRELALHMILGPRVDKRTLEKVLRTIGAGVREGLDAAGVKVPGTIALLEVRSTVRVADLYKTVTTIIPRYPTLRTLLLTRPTRSNNAGASSSNPPSPVSPTFYFPSPPATPGFPPTALSISLHPPPSPSFAAAQALPSSPHTLLPIPPSPTASSVYASAPSTPTSLAPATPTYRRTSVALLPPGLLPPPSPSGSTFSRRTATQSSWTWEWDGWRDAGDVLTDAGLDHWDDERERLYLEDADPYGYDAESMASGDLSIEDPDVTDVISWEDAARVTAWRRHCRLLERVRMVSGAWWIKDEADYYV
ncbi:hypothetical protein C8F01DRAFT_1226004 [Mycena amicta]|nr:hypothetical protein C8F01DRAFT_1226004 [Mycena amicta]